VDFPIGFGGFRLFPFKQDMSDIVLVYFLYSKQLKVCNINSKLSDCLDVIQ